MARVRIGRDYYIDESKMTPFMRRWLAERGYSTKYRTKTPVTSHIRKTGRRLTRVRRHLRSVVKRARPRRIVRRTIRYEPKRLTELELRNLKTIPEREFDIANDLIDTHALIDSSLTYNENAEIIREHVGGSRIKKQDKPIEQEAEDYVDNLVYKVASGENHNTTEELKHLAKKGMMSD
jgi:hypothetical protein